MSSEEAVKPIADAIIENELLVPSVFMNLISWGTSFVLTIVKCVAMFTTVSVGMVYYK